MTLEKCKIKPTTYSTSLVRYAIKLTFDDGDIFYVEEATVEDIEHILTINSTKAYILHDLNKRYVVLDSDDVSETE